MRKFTRRRECILSAAELYYLDSDNFDPSEKVVHEALSLLGQGLEALIQPFINRDLSLSDQIISLVKCAHIFCALFVKHGTSFMSNQLYGDIQCMIKNAIFHVAKTQDLDSTLRVFICLLGDDVLETLFGRVRMIGGHSPNVDISEMEARCRSALILDDIYSRHPEWERKAECLKITRNRDYDHLRPRDWRANLVAGDCDLQICWKKGVQAADSVLQRFRMDIDFVELFSRSGFDLMRPKGGKYPGISTDFDRSLDDVYETSSPSLSGTPTDTVSQLLASAADFDPLVCETEDTADIQSMDATPFHDVWIHLDDHHRQHKKTVLRIVFDPTHDINYQTTHDRLLRVRHFSIGGDKWDRRGGLCHGNGSLAAHEVFSINNLFATLIRVNGTDVGVGIAQATLIRATASSTSIHSAPTSEINLPSSSYEISGELLALRPFTSSDGDSVSWAWDASYITLQPKKSRQSRQPPVSTAQSDTTRKGDYVFTVPGMLVIPIDGRGRSFDVCNLPESVEMQRDIDSTWVFTDALLVQLRTQLWDKVKEPDSPLQSRIPTYGCVMQGIFPYSSSVEKDNVPQVSHLAGKLTVAAAKDQRIVCSLCGKSVAGSERQNHTGRHIACARLGVNDKNVIAEKVVPDYACGFCAGPVEDGKCAVSIGPGNKVISSCTAAFSFQITSASKVSISKPCTNRPIRCTLCSQTTIEWSYNMPHHMEDCHPSWKQQLTPDFIAKMGVSQSEQEAFGLANVPCPPVGAGNATHSSSKRPASSPPGTPQSKAREEQQQRKNRRVEVIDWNNQ